jgi:hypothetical protein
VSEPCFVEFAIHDAERLERLTAIVDELRLDKAAGTLEPGPKWRPMFDDRALAHFWWPTPSELDDWRRRWEATPLPGRWADPSLQRPWDFDSLIEAFANGEYQILGIRRQGGTGRLEFEPDAFPYGGTGCMQALVEAFDFVVTTIDDGSQPPYRP